jgi:hypothetical protein
LELIRQLTAVLLIEICALSILATIVQIDFQSTAVLLIFNALFVTLMFQLNGGGILKLGLLAAGNLLGVLWNFCFHMLFLSAAESYVISDANLKVLYGISYPFLNSLWVISFWSLSLTFLRYRQRVSF